MGFTKDDLLKYNGLKSVISDAKFDIKGRAAIQVAVLIQWYDSLEAKMKEAVKDFAMNKPSTITPIGKPKKIKGKKDDHKS